MKRILIIALIVVSLSGCGFRPRSAADIPPQLHTLYLKTQQPYNPLITELKSLLKSLNIQLAQSHLKAPYTLNITNIRFSQSNPPITTTTLAVTLTYSLSMKVEIDDAQGKPLIPTKSLSASRSISQNPSQVYTPGTATLAKQELRRDLTSQLYYLLVSNKLRNALNHVSQPT